LPQSGRQPRTGQRAGGILPNANGSGTEQLSPAWDGRQTPPGCPRLCRLSVGTERVARAGRPRTGSARLEPLLSAVLICVRQFRNRPGRARRPGSSPACESGSRRPARARGRLRKPGRRARWLRARASTVMVGARGVGPTLYGYSSTIRGRGRQLPRSRPERSEWSQAHANPLIGDLDPTSLPGPRSGDNGRRQATAALGALCMTLDDPRACFIGRVGCVVGSRGVGRRFPTGIRIVSASGQFATVALPLAI